MSDEINKNKDIENEGEQKDLHAYVPEPEMHRPIFYGFRRNYPEQESPTSTHTESFAQTLFKRKVRYITGVSLLILAAFLFSLLITKTALNVSNAPLPETTAPTTTAAPTTAAPTTVTEATTTAETTTSAETTTKKKPTTAAPTTAVPTTAAPTDTSPTAAEPTAVTQTSEETT